MSARYLFISIILIIVYACAPKTVKVAKEETYEEDLSFTIPEVDPYESPVSLPEIKSPAIFREPSEDITMELDSLLDSIAVVNRQTPYYQYTVLVHNSNSRQAADEARRNVFRVLPEANPQMQFVSPSYRVKIGKYFTRIDAYQTLVKLKELFPNAVIVPEQVYIK